MFSNLSLLPSFIKLIIAALVLLLAGFVILKLWPNVDFLKFIKNKLPEIPMKGVLKVVPEQIDFTSSDWGRAYTIRVVNNTDEDLYSIWIKVAVESKTISEGDISIDDMDNINTISEKIADIEINFDAILIGGEEPGGRDIKMLLVYSLKSNEEKNYRLRISPKQKKDDEQTKLSLSIAGYSEEETQIVYNKDKAAIMFKPPENITMKSVAFKLSKIAK